MVIPLDPQSITCSLHIQISVKELQAGLAVDADKIVRKSLPSAEEFIEILVTKTDDLVILEGAWKSRRSDFVFS